jgi:hypothetical protein
MAVVKWSAKNPRFVGSADSPEAWIDLECFVSDREMIEQEEPRLKHVEVERPIRCLSMSSTDSFDPPGRKMAQTIGIWGAGSFAGLQFPG